MRSLTTVLLLSLVALAMGCAPSVTVTLDYDKEMNFAALNTFAWLPIPVNPPANVKEALERNSLMDKRIRRAVEAQLAVKAYHMHETNPDFMITYHIGIQEKIAVTDWGYDYGRRGWGAPSRIDVYQYQEGTLVLDVIDSHSKQLIWRSVAQGVIDPSAPIEKREQRLNDVVTRMLADFPPAGK
ncbi:hypothetical protein MELA_00958 [Candidatus Methylomirabilis lanthanidiphila]|uniref:DUF4136 domain-containing protein n=1 Tax=Candidatus Methylomirabilis lanthanidiphila TaxID=2211376 RepID=A0A564ZH11_9BACT|nr:DUF4136 domain-containing protein [Candidatus Methylomirabilis lanthanidiphila]VUZ84585.1 hypothetical protein MELA_00958 [Candidatus Methylomirabilis lanthanidiphila]